MQDSQWYESNGLNCVFANKGNRRKSLRHLFITKSSSHFFNKTDFKSSSCLRSVKKQQHNTMNKTLLPECFGLVKMIGRIVQKNILHFNRR